jgi:hypothetical protein
MAEWLITAYDRRTARREVFATGFSKGGARGLVYCFNLSSPSRNHSDYEFHHKNQLPTEDYENR